MMQVVQYNLSSKTIAGPGQKWSLSRDDITRFYCIHFTNEFLSIYSYVVHFIYEIERIPKVLGNDGSPLFSDLLNVSTHPFSTHDKVRQCLYKMYFPNK